MNIFILPGYALNSKFFYYFKKIALALNNPQMFICH